MPDAPPGYGSAPPTAGQPPAAGQPPTAGQSPGLPGASLGRAMGVEALLALVAEREAEGRIDQAIGLLDRGLADAARLLARRGQLAGLALRAREAMGSLALALALDPGNAQVELELALMAREQGEFERSLSHWQHLMATHPQLMQPCFEAGALQAVAGRLDCALAAFARMPEAVTDGYWLATMDHVRQLARAARGEALALLARRRERASARAATQAGGAEGAGGSAPGGGSGGGEAGGLERGEWRELVRALLRLGRVRAARRLLDALPDGTEEAILRFQADRRSMTLADAAAALRVRAPGLAPGPQAGAGTGAGPGSGNGAGAGAVAASGSAAPADPHAGPDGAAGEVAFLVADAFYQAGQPEQALAVLAPAPFDALPPAVQELLFRAHAARGDTPACLALAGRMIDARPQDPTPAQLVIGALLASGALRPMHDARSGLPAGFGHIPAVLFQFWDQPEVPEEVQAVMRSWQDPAELLAPVLFDDAKARAFIAAHFPPDHLAAYAACHHAAMKSDFVRLCYLCRWGGIYLDVDESCADTPAALLRVVSGQSLVLPLLGSATAYANNALIAAVPQHPVLVRALAEAVRSLATLEPGARPDIWNTTGPGLITRSLVAHLREHGTSEGGITLLTDRAWRQICGARNSLAYKGTAAGNWRLA